MYAIAQPAVIISENAQQAEATPVVASENPAQIIAVLPGAMPAFPSVIAKWFVFCYHDIH